MQDLIAGQIDYQCPGAAVAIGHIDSRTVKPIVTLKNARSPSLPELPSAQEQGLPDFDASLWYAFFPSEGHACGNCSEATRCDRRNHGHPVRHAAPERNRRRPGRTRAPLVAIPSEIRLERNREVGSAYQGRGNSGGMIAFIYDTPFAKS